MPTRSNFPPRVDSRRESATARKEAREALSDAAQLARLDTILGEGRGARKERARLATKISNATPQRKSKVKK